MRSIKQTENPHSPGTMEYVIHEAEMCENLGSVREIRTFGKMWITHDGAFVGFLCPRVTKSGRLRCGPIFVVASHRKMGLALDAIKTVMNGSLLPTWWTIDDTNTASQRLAIAAGLTRRHRASRFCHYWSNA